jgi:hypothetical protein
LQHPLVQGGKLGGGDFGMSEGLVEFDKSKPRRPSSRALAPLVAIDQSSGAARFMNRMRKDIERELGGRKFLSRLELEYIEAFVGSATRLKYHNHQLMLGECEADLENYFRIGKKLGLRRRDGKDTTARSEEPIKQSFSALAAAEFDRTSAGAAASADDLAGSNNDEVA